jgi:hypothetical protein
MECTVTNALRTAYSLKPDGKNLGVCELWLPPLSYKFNLYALPRVSYSLFCTTFSNES